jgi:hypothetical protein
MEVLTVLMKILVVWSVDGLFNYSEDEGSDMAYLEKPGCQYKFNLPAVVYSTPLIS